MGNVKILKASAGSGKTYQLAYAYIRNVIRDPGRYRHILAVTFTNKATEEMKQRIISEINRLACGAPDGYLPELVRDLELPPDTIRRRAREARTRILHDYSHFTIVTIDKFFQRIIRSFIKELGIDINFNLELQTDPLLDTAADRLIEAIATDDKLRKWIVRFAEEQIDRNGKWDVRSEIVALGRELFREQYKTLQSEPVTPEKLTAVVGEAIARSRAVKDEMRRTASEALAVIADAGLRPEDFAYGRQGCTGYLTRINNGEMVPYGKRVQDALGSDDKWVSAKSPHRAKILSLVPQLRGLFGRLCETFDRNFRFLNTTRLLQTNYRSFALLNNLNEKIAEVCAEQHLIPISETNSIINKLIAGNDTPFIYEKTGNTFSHFMIDEFQDTSSQQWQNFVPLLENAVAQQDEFPVLLVGDVKQSIYRWRGGDWQILGRKVREAFGQIAEQTLDTNYRSSGTIVAFNNNLIERCVRSANESLNRLLDASAGEGTISASLRRELTDMLAEAYSDLKQKQHRAPQAGYVRITAYDPPEEETARTPVIETVEELQRRGYAPGDIAVLVRTNAQGVAVARQLLDYKASRPDTPYCYDVVTQEALQIGNSDTVGFIIAVLQIASSPDDRIRIAFYNRYLGRNLDEPPTPDESAWIGRLRLLSLEEAFSEIVLFYRLAEKKDEIAYIQALEEQIHAFGTSRIADIPLFLQWWDESGRTQSIHLPRNRDAINIITIHKSKGLQYKAVCIPYCNWSLQPKTGSLLWARSPEAPFDTLEHVPLEWNKALAESYFSEAYFRETVLAQIDNINLFYVAATRAEEELHIQFPRSAQENTARIHQLILGSIETDGEGNAKIGTLQGHFSETEQGLTYDFGTPAVSSAEEHAATGYPASYPVEKNHSKLKFRLSSQRYFEQDDPPAPSLRDHGILMHRLFEQVADRTEIMPRLQQMRRNGLLSDNEAQQVQALLDKALDDPLIASWFDSRWSAVRNENTILVPNAPTVRRPDRVLTRGTEAVVIDYKFGRKKRTAHTRQIEAYMRLLRDMGYRSVTGYLWYVELQEIERVAANAVG